MFFSPLQVKKHKGPTSRKQAAKSRSCLQSSPCRSQSQGSSLPTWAASGSWRARCGTCSSSWARPGLRTSCWRGSSIATWWHCSTSRTQRAASPRLVLSSWCLTAQPDFNHCHKNMASAGYSSLKDRMLISVWTMHLTSIPIYYSNFKSCSLGHLSRQEICIISQH